MSVDVKNIIKGVFFLLVLLCGVLAVEAQEEGARHEALVSSGASVMAERGGSFSNTLGQTAFSFDFYGEGGAPIEGSVELGIQHVYCEPYFDTVNVVAEKQYGWMGNVYESTGRYTEMRFSMEGCDSIFTLDLTISNPSQDGTSGSGMAAGPKIYSFQDQVILVDHSSDEEDEDGDEYVDYRWYRDGVLVTEGSDYFQEAGRGLGGCYYLEVTTSSDPNEWRRSNTICIDTFDRPTFASVDFSIAPNPVPQAGVMRVMVGGAFEDELEGARLVVYDLKGREMMSRPASISNVLNAPETRGVYTMHLLLSSGVHVPHKFLVR